RRRASLRDSSVPESRGSSCVRLRPFACSFGYSQFGQLALPPLAMGELGMWNHEIGLVDVLVAESHDVEIERAGAPADGAHAAGLLLDALQLGQQLAWRQ